MDEWINKMSITIYPENYVPNPYFIKGDTVVRTRDVKGTYASDVSEHGKILQTQDDSMIVEWSDGLICVANTDNLMHTDAEYSHDHGHYLSESRSRNLRCYHQYYRK